LRDQTDDCLKQNSAYELIKTPRREIGGVLFQKKQFKAISDFYPGCPRPR